MAHQALQVGFDVVVDITALLVDPHHVVFQRVPIHLFLGGRHLLVSVHDDVGSVCILELFGSDVFCQSI